MRHHAKLSILLKSGTKSLINSVTIALTHTLWWTLPYDQSCQLLANQQKHAWTPWNSRVLCSHSQFINLLSLPPLTGIDWHNWHAFRLNNKLLALLVVEQNLSDSNTIPCCLYPTKLSYPQSLFPSVHLAIIFLNHATTLQPMQQFFVCKDPQAIATLPTITTP